LATGCALAPVLCERGPADSPLELPILYHDAVLFDENRDGFPAFVTTTKRLYWDDDARPPRYGQAEMI